MKNGNIKKEINWLLEEKYGGAKPSAFFKDVEKLKRGEPVDYVIGFVKFLGCRIDLSKRPLIPRPETECWTERAINELQIASGKLRVLDIFAGSGCVGIAILKNNPTARIKVDFAEKEKKFCEQIKINCSLNKINPKRHRIIQSDLFSKIKNKYDFVLANPPYVAETKKGKVQKSVLKWEPKDAVFSGKDGLFYAGKFLSQAEKFLNPGGKIYMEFDSWQKPKITAVLEQNKYKNYAFFKDQYNKFRYVIINK